MESKKFFDGTCSTAAHQQQLQPAAAEWWVVGGTYLPVDIDNLSIKGSDQIILPQNEIRLKRKNLET